MTDEYSFCFLCFNKGWCLVSAQKIAFLSFKQEKHSSQDSVEA